MATTAGMSARVNARMRAIGPGHSGGGDTPVSGTVIIGVQRSGEAVKDVTQIIERERLPQDRPIGPLEPVAGLG